MNLIGGSKKRAIDGVGACVHFIQTEKKGGKRAWGPAAAINENKMYNENVQQLELIHRATHDLL